MTLAEYLGAIKERLVADPLVADFQIVRERETLTEPPHFPQLAGFPDHIHDGMTGDAIPGTPMSLLTVLEEIPRLLSGRTDK